MIALYALGMMSMTWMVLVTGLIVTERLLPRRRVVNAIAAVLVALGVAVAAVPADLPALTIPAGHAAMAMH
jgi:predicted metal-binding membrane protein